MEKGINAVLDGLLETLAALEEHKRYKRFDYFRPYTRQAEFFALGSTIRERLLSAGNQLGKTEAGAFEATCHLTGEYPPWWTGRRYDRPVRAWFAGETSNVVRDVQQKKLCGEPGVDEAFGTGMIPRDRFAGAPTMARGISDAYDTIQVRHKSGGISVAKFKSYEQGRKKFQGDTLDFIWLDEEPPMDIYSECLTRVTATNGFVYTTFTPLQGKTDLVVRFWDEDSPERARVNMTIMDAEHIPADMRAAIIAGYPAHERDARVNGVPMMGEGRVFLYPEELIRETPLEYIPPHWRKLWGVDFGIDHPFAAVLQLWDPDNDVIHIHHTIRQRARPGEPGGLPMNHARAMKQVGAAVPVAWPHDGHNREKGTGVSLAVSYRKEGLLMLPTHATFPEGGYGTEQGIFQIQQYMEDGRYKVAAHLVDWWEEYRNYHRKDGLVVKMNDDLMSASRIAFMQRRSSRAVALGGRFKPKPRSGDVAAGLDFDVFGT